MRALTRYAESRHASASFSRFGGRGFIGGEDGDRGCEIRAHEPHRKRLEISIALLPRAVWLHARPTRTRLQGRDLERGTGILGAELRGEHLRLPGHGADGPTLEIFNYNLLEEKSPIAVNRPGFGHIAFVVDDVSAAREAVLAAGGQPVGEVVTMTNAAGVRLTWVYVTDPEGNVLELQSRPK